MQDLTGRLAVVTGGSAGIGKAVAEALAQRGCRLVILARGVAGLESTVEALREQGHKANGYVCDLAEPALIRSVLESIIGIHGTIDILVNNAGSGSFSPLTQYRSNDLLSALSVPACSAIQATCCVLPGMQAKQQGFIVNVLTPASYFPLPYMAPYTASRWALNGFSQSLYLEVKNQGIHVGSVCPGRVDTDYLSNNDADINWWPRIARIFPIVSPELVATKVLKLIDNQQRESIFPWLLWIFVRVHGLFPKTVIRLLEMTRLFQPPRDTDVALPQRQVTPDTATNWEESIKLNPSTVVYPETAEDIVGIVTDATSYPSPLRSAGSRHSTTHCAVSDRGTLLVTRRLDRIVSIDNHGLTVTAQAGALYIDVAKALEARGLQFYVNVEIGNLTMGSAACTGTKDASFPGEMGQVCSYLVSARVITSDGQEIEVNESDPELLQAFRSSYGLLGVVHEVTFRVRRLQAMSVHHRTYTLDEFEHVLPELKQEPYSIMYYLFPFNNNLTVEFRRYDSNAQPSGRKAWWLRNLAWKTLAPAVSALATRYIKAKGLRFTVLDNFYRLLQVILDRVVHSNSSYPADQVIRYPEKKGLSKYTFSIWAFPEENIVDTMRAYYGFCQAYYREHGYRCDVLNVGYRIEQDQNPLFSYSWQGNVMTLDPVCTATEPGWDEFLKAYNQFCHEHNGVPLFNQSKWLTPEQVDKAFGSRVLAFEKTRRQLDPEGRFLNDYFRELFVAPNEAILSAEPSSRYRI